MLDEKLGWLPEDKLDPTCPPPPYASYLGSGDDSEKKKPPSALHAVQRNATGAQQQGKGSKGSTSIWGRVLCRIISGVSRHPQNEIYPTTATAAAVAAAAAAAAVKRDGQPNVSEGLLRWVGHNGMTCGHGATSTKRTLPLAPPPCADRYSFDVLFCPPPQPFASEGARWQQARICFSSNDLSKLRGSIPWRANLDSCCYMDRICFVNYPYPTPFFLDGPSGKIKAYNYTPCGGTSVGGHTYERTIRLGLLHDRTDWAYWSFTLSLTSRDGAWLAGLSRADAAAITGLDSAIRVIGWVHPEPDSINGSKVFYVKTLNHPWLEATDLSHGQPQFPLDVSHHVEMRQLMDETIERFIQGGD
ncbi:hypothetical protein B0T25DRAFT_559748 [Lasiosphaeria hispida]|uniref:Uncharacterized protein n=1 Tax=Lasiosphaeria hispida TaxID=260671 RepID=A0AAJ0H7B2_9PEZI|nr:hypothetical protein B0T25DRAFT_559748 [Lasiosphaeria hispida]